MTSYKELLSQVTTFVFDYDGVLTDGTILIDRDGELLRTANVRDGFAIRQAVKKGFKVAIISGGRTESIRKRFAMLDVHNVYLGVGDKLSVFNQFCAEEGVKPSEVLFMGDDIPDFEVMTVAGVPCCPSDAAEEIKSVAVYISQYRGGRGCARDVIEQVLRVKNQWFDKQAFSWDV